MYEHQINGVWGKSNFKEKDVSSKGLRKFLLSYWNVLKRDEKYAAIFLIVLTIVAITLTLVFNHLSAQPPVFIYHPY